MFRSPNELGLRNSCGRIAQLVCEMASDERFILKVLTGPNQGAELELSAGAYMIGSADECDVNFSDALVAPRHLSVELSEDSIVAKRLDGKVFVDGKPMVDTRQTIKFFQFVTAGSTYFLFGPAGREWPRGCQARCHRSNPKPRPSRRVPLRSRPKVWKSRRTKRHRPIGRKRSLFSRFSSLASWPYRHFS